MHGTDGDDQDSYSKKTVQIPGINSLMRKASPFFIVFTQTEKGIVISIQIRGFHQ